MLTIALTYRVRMRRLAAFVLLLTLTACGSASTGTPDASDTPDAPAEPQTSTAIDGQSIEDEVTKQLKDQDFPAEVECPSSMEPEQGATSDCIATFEDDTKGRIEIRWQNDQGEYVWEVV